MKSWEKLWEILEKNWGSFGEKFRKILRTVWWKTFRKTWWNFENKLVKFWKNFRKILKKVWWNVEKNLVKFWKKICKVLEIQEICFFNFEFFLNFCFCVYLFFYSKCCKELEYVLVLFILLNFHAWSRIWASAKNWKIFRKKKKYWKII